MTKATVAGPGTALNLDYTDIPLYTLTANDAGGDWRAIFTAVDDHANETRDHQPNRMMAVNRVRPHRKVIAILDPGHGWFYNYSSIHYKQNRGGAQTYDGISGCYYEDDGVVRIAAGALSALSSPSAQTLVAGSVRTRRSTWDVDLNAENQSVGCTEHDLVEAGKETCPLGARTFDVRTKQAKSEASQHNARGYVIAFVSIHTNPSGDALGHPACFYQYAGNAVNGTQELGQCIVTQLHSLQLAAFAPVIRSPELHNLQVLDFAGADLKMRTAADYNETWWDKNENGVKNTGEVITAEQKAAEFASWTGAECKYPAVLVECYSHGEPEWAARLDTNNQDILTKLGVAMANGLVNFAKGCNGIP